LPRLEESASCGEARKYLLVRERTPTECNIMLKAGVTKEQLNPFRYKPEYRTTQQKGSFVALCSDDRIHKVVSVDGDKRHKY
jgi:hypothetical protein